MYLYFHDQLLKTYVVAVGMSDYTPPGYYRISYKEKDPALYWYDEYIPPDRFLTEWGQDGYNFQTLNMEFTEQLNHGK